MGRTDAVASLKTHPLIARHVKAGWLDQEGQKQEGLWHPLYEWLQAGPDHAGAAQVLNTIEAALGADLRGRVVSRGRRLAGGDAGDYWSALSELYLSAALVACGLRATLGNPDIVVREMSDGSEVAFELTSIRQTVTAARLHGMVASGWTGQGQPLLRVLDERAHITVDQARTIRAEMLRADALLSLQEGDEREVDVGGITPSSLLRVFLSGRDPRFCVTRTGRGTVAVDIWPELERRVSEKASQISGCACGVVAVEGAYAQRSAYVWADEVGAGYETPTLQGPPNIAGVMLFWTDVRRHAPLKSVFVRNQGWQQPDPLALTRALECFDTILAPGRMS